METISICNCRTNSNKSEHKLFTIPLYIVRKPLLVYSNHVHALIPLKNHQRFFVWKDYSCERGNPGRNYKDI